MDLYFDWPGRHAPSEPHSHYPKALALLTALERQGLVQGTDETPNASVFVKWKSEAEAAFILNLKIFNHTRAYEARRFKLPTLEGLADLMRARGGGWATKIDLGNCYWSATGFLPLFACPWAGTRPQGWSSTSSQP